jgi:hypothetical protein
MICIKIPFDTKPALGEAIRKLNWQFSYNHRGIPDRIIDHTGLLVAFNNTRQHVDLEFKHLRDARQFLQTVEELQK